MSDGDVKSRCIDSDDVKGNRHGYQASDGELPWVYLADRKIEDLLGMQNANLLNLPENYTFKYCELRASELS